MLETGIAAPDLSVIIPAVNGPAPLIECLDALRANAATGTSLEIIVVERCGDSTRRAIADRASEIRVLPVSAQTPIPQMRALGFAHATGTAVAVIEDHVIVPPHWARQILDALSNNAKVVGGSLYNAATRTAVDRAAFLCEYSHLISPSAGRDVAQLTGTNVAYRRELIDRYSGVLAKGRWEDYLHDALRRDGVALSCVPEIAVGHKMHYRMSEYLSQRYLFSRALTGSRAEDLTAFRRALGILKSAALPPVLLARIVRRALGSDRYRRDLPTSLPLLAVFVCAWAMGEAVGYAAGPGDSLARVR
jgi:glycosyltransferase involved in cell wall biosynthesis